jgi:hypothetical protein
MSVILLLSLLAAVLWVPFDTVMHLRGWKRAALNYARMFALGFVLGQYMLATGDVWVRHAPRCSGG